MAKKESPFSSPKTNNKEKKTEDKEETETQSPAKIKRRGPDRPSWSASQRAGDAQWYEEESAQVLPLPKGKTKRAADGSNLLAGVEEKNKAMKLLKKLSDEFDEKKKLSDKSDAKWLKQVLNTGTLTDKIAAMTLMVQEAPLYRLATLDTLMAMARKKGRREAGLALDALKDLFVSTLLPDRKLRKFHEQPFDALNDKEKSKSGHQRSIEKARILYWYFEDQIKTRYSEFIGLLESGTHDGLNHIKKNRMIAISELLNSKPEQEKALLTMLVNKLGDPQRSVAAKAVFLLNLFLQRHPGTKTAVVKEVESLLFRPHISSRAQYCGIIFLNQITFQAGESVLAWQLVGVYVSLFNHLTAPLQKITSQSKGEDDDETTINQSINEMLEKKKKQPEKKDSLKEEFSMKKKKKGKKKKGKKKTEKEDGLTILDHDGLHIKLLGGLLSGLNRAFPFANAESEIEGEERPTFEKEMETLFRVVHSEGGAAFNLSIQALMLIFQIMTAKSTLNDRFYRALYDKLLSKELFASSSKHALVFNLLFRAIKQDTSNTRVCAFAKRLLQVCLHHQPPFICGTLYLISEVTKSQTFLKDMIQFSAKGASVDEDVEIFRDISDENETDENEKKVKVKNGLKTTDKGDSDNESVQPSNGGKSSEGYNPLKREPQHSRADLTCLWELTLLGHHYHPSVTRFARVLLTGNVIVYAGDPLKDFTHMGFLNRFVHKNPKKPKESEFQRKSRTRKSVDEKALIHKAESSVPDDEVFFYKYFVEKAARAPKKEYGEQVDLEDAADAIVEKEMERLGFDPDDDLEFSSDDEAEEKAEDDEDQVGDILPSGPGSDDDDESDGMLDDDAGGSDGDDFGVEEETLFDDEDDDDKGKWKQKEKKKKKKTDVPVFASADDYDHLLQEKEIPTQGRGGGDADGDDDDDGDDDLAFLDDDDGEDDLKSKKRKSEFSSDRASKRNRADRADDSDDDRPSRGRGRGRGGRGRGGRGRGGRGRGRGGRGRGSGKRGRGRGRRG